MIIDFAECQLALIETEHAAETRLPVAVIQSARHQLSLIRAAPDERTLINWRSLGYERLMGEQEGKQAIRINSQLRLVIRLDDIDNPKKVIVLGLEKASESGGRNS